MALVRVLEEFFVHTWIARSTELCLCLRAWCMKSTQCDCLSPTVVTASYSASVSSRHIATEYARVLHVRPVPSGWIVQLLLFQPLSFDFGRRVQSSVCFFFVL